MHEEGWNLPSIQLHSLPFIRHGRMEVLAPGARDTTQCVQKTIRALAREQRRRSLEVVGKPVLDAEIERLSSEAESSTARRKLAAYRLRRSQLRLLESLWGFDGADPLDLIKDELRDEL